MNYLRDKIINFFKPEISELNERIQCLKDRIECLEIVVLNKEDGDNVIPYILRGYKCGENSYMIIFKEALIILKL